MKVLFLDIDGVCNSRDWQVKGNSLWHGVDPEAAARVKRIIVQTGCSVVLSSVWRLYEESRDTVKAKVCDFIDVTPDMQKGAQRGVTPRGIEVEEWLQKNPGVERYAILDDDADFLPSQPLFKTTFQNGLTDEIAQQVIDYLNA